jgi:hypothetical protein
VQVVGDGGVDVVARNQVARLVRRRRGGHDVHGEQQPERDRDAEEEPRAEHTERLGVPAPQRLLGVIHALDEDEVVHAHQARIGGPGPKV